MTAADTPETTSKRPSRKGARWSAAVGIVLGVAGLVLVGQRIAQESDAVGEAISDAKPGWFVLAFIAAFAGMTVIAATWRRALSLLGSNLDTTAVVWRYYVGEIGKYLPGGVWPVMGRSELVFRAGVARSAAYGSVALSLGALYLGALITAAGLLPIALVGGSSSSAPMLLLLLVPLGLVALHPAVAGRGVDLLRRVTRRPLAIEVPSWSQSVGLVIRYVPSWLLIGTSTWAVARALYPGADWPEIVLATMLSWTAGFVAVPVPGGVGVREAAFLAVAASLPSGVAATTALVSRVMFMAVDVLGALIGSAWLGSRSRAAAVQAEP